MKSIIKYTVYILIIALVSCDNMDITPDQANAFIKTYGDWSTDIGVDVKPYNNGYLMLATTTSVDSANTNITIIRTDKYGNLKEEYVIDGGGNDKAGSLLLTEDGDFIVIGTYEDTLNTVDELDSDNYNTDIYIGKFNSSFELQWEKYIGEVDIKEEGTAIKKAYEGYIIAGSTDRSDEVTGNQKGTKDVYLVKTDDSGNVEWDRNYGGENVDYASDIIVYYNGYVVIGSSNSFSEDGQNLFNVLLLKTNFSGGETHKFTYGSIYNDYGNAIAEDDDGFILVGSVENISGSNADAYVIKVDKEDFLDIIWNHTFGSNLYDQAFDIVRTFDGFVIAGSAEISNDNNSAYFIKIDGEGNELLETTVGNYNQTIYSLEATSDGGYIMIGSSGYVGNEMICLMKVNAEGEF